MEKLYRTHSRLVAATNLKFKRYLAEKIDWNNHLIIIKGAKGVGKTTLILQHIKEKFSINTKALYTTLDNVWFATHSLLELAEYHYTHGGTHLFLDEVHKYNNWQQEVKNIYDSYPNFNVVITGSSMLKLEESIVADLSRRCRVYTLEGMSFREFLKLENIADLPIITLNDIVKNHVEIATEITSKVKVLGHFDNYIKYGYYPFYKQEGDGFYDRLQLVVSAIIESEIPAMNHVEYATIVKARQLVGVMSELPPMTLNISSLCTTLQTSRNNLLKIIDLLDKAAIFRRLYSQNQGFKALNKPEKILFHNTNLIFALSSKSEIGTSRETFFASQLSVLHQLTMPEMGDFVVNNKFTFEVGGKGKKFKQIKNIEDSFVVSDNTDIGFANKIPLWIFGIMY